MTEQKTADDFVPTTTRRGGTVHFAEADRPRRTLCGRGAYPLNDPNWPTCKQCEKSRQRGIDGEPS